MKRTKNQGLIKILLEASPKFWKNKNSLITSLKQFIFLHQNLSESSFSANFKGP